MLGCSGSGPSREVPASGYLVRTATTAIWLDAGTGTFMALAAEMDPAALDAVVISHLHTDHCADLFGLLHYLAYRIGVANGLPVLLPPGAIATLAGFLGGGPDDDLYTTFAPREVGDGDVVAVGDVVVRFAAATHSVPTNAVRIEHGGRSLTYSGDTGQGGGFPGLAAGCSTLLCEAGLTGRRDLGTYPFHLSGREAGALAATAGAGRLILTHLAPTLPAEEIAAAAMRTFAGTVLVAEPGLRVEV